MFVGGLGDSFALLLVLAGIGAFCLAALAMALLMRFAGLRWSRALGVAFAVSFAALLGLGLYVKVSTRDRLPPKPIPLEIPVRAWGA